MPKTQHATCSIASQETGHSTQSQPGAGTFAGEWTELEMTWREYRHMMQTLQDTAAQRLGEPSLAQRFKARMQGL